MSLGPSAFSFPKTLRFSQDRPSSCRAANCEEPTPGRWRHADHRFRPSVWAFGYPFGNAATVTGRDLRLAEQAGFRCAFMNTRGGCGWKIVGAKISPFALPRVHVPAQIGLAELEAPISGLYRALCKLLPARRGLHTLA